MRKYIEDVAKVGGKAASLAKMHNLGLPVPDFICLETSEFEACLKKASAHNVVSWMVNDNNARDIIPDSFSQIVSNMDIPEKTLSRIKNFVGAHSESYFAVRSSATLEDGVQNSFAGMFDTVLGVKTVEDILSAVRQCWESLFSETVVAYLKNRDLSQPIGMALVIQVMVDADISGVTFTVDPQSGRDTQFRIEACYGLGDAMVAGQITPDSYIYDWYEKRLVHVKVADKPTALKLVDGKVQNVKLSEAVSSSTVLNPELMRKCVSLFLEAQMAYGTPVDIEWATNGENVYLLQCRPITAIGHAGIEGEWTTADFRDGGVSSRVCTTLMASLYDLAINHSMDDHLRQIGMIGKAAEGTQWMSVHYARPYWNVGVVKSAMLNVPDFIERDFDEGIGITPKYTGPGRVSKLTPRTLVRGLKTLSHIQAGIRKSYKNTPANITKLKALIKDIEAHPRRELSDAEFGAWLRQYILQDYIKVEGTYFDFIYYNSHVNSSLRAIVDKYSSRDGLQAELLGGLTGVSHLAPINHLWALRTKILASDAATEFWTRPAKVVARDLKENVSAAHAAEFAGFVSEYGYHAKRELAIETPRYSEDTVYVVEQLQSILSLPDKISPDERARVQMSVYAQARLELSASVPFWRKRKVRSLLKRVRKFLTWREALRDVSTRNYALVRTLALEAGERLVELGVLEQISDVFYFTPIDICDGLQGFKPSSELRVILDRNIQYAMSFSNFDIPDEIGGIHAGGLSDAEGHAPEAFVRGAGIAGSQGRVKGTARIIKDISEADRLEVGDILVTRCTDPSWTLKFSILSAVVTETGGMLSHAAVICREFGIPAVLAVKNASDMIQDGEQIVVDGNRGLVMRVSADNPDLEEGL